MRIRALAGQKRYLKETIGSVCGGGIVKGSNLEDRDF